jgi:integrase
MISSVRDYGSGSIVDAGGGRWRLRISAGTDPFTGRRRVINETVYGTRTDARRRLAELVAENGGRPGSTGSTLGRIIDVWLDVGQHAKATRRNYDRIRSYIPRRLLDTPAVKVTPHDIDRLLSAIGNAHGAHTAHTLHALVSGAFRNARRLRWLRENPASDALIPDAPQRAKTTPTAVEARRIIAAAIGQLEQLWLRLALVLGRRRAEVIALRWSDIDLDGLAVMMQRALERDGTPKPTKNEDQVGIAIDPVTAKMIRSWQLAQRERALAAGKPLEPDPWLISDELDSSRPWRPDRATKLWAAIRERATVRTEIRLHDFRHANESELIAAGIDVRTVAGRAGHDPAMALSRYAKMVDAANRRAAEAIAAVIDG